MEKTNKLKIMQGGRGGGGGREVREQLHLKCVSLVINYVSSEV